MPARTPKPTIRNGKKMRWKVTGNSPFSCSATKSKVPRSAWAKIAIRAIQMSTLPATRYSMSFIAPYSLVRMNVEKSELLPHTAMRRYMGSTASS